MQTALGHGHPSMLPSQHKTPDAGVSARRKASLCSASASLTRAAQWISPKPLEQTARVLVGRWGLGPACLLVAFAHVLDGGSILNPRPLVWWGCLLIASLMAWRRRVAKSPCSRPHRPREKQGVHSALTLLAWCTMLPCIGGVILRGPSVTSDTYIRKLYANWNLNAEPQGWWDGPLTINTATPQVISGVTTDTSALLIKFDLRSFVGATLMPNKTAWLNYFVTDTGNSASLRELLVPWNESTVTWTNLPFASSSWSSTNVGGVGLPGAFPGVVTGWQRFDVTSSVAAWLAGSRANNGWIALPTGGTNGVRVELSTSRVGTTAVLSPFLDFTTLFAGQ